MRATEVNQVFFLVFRDRRVRNIHQSVRKVLLKRHIVKVRRKSSEKRLIKVNFCMLHGPRKSKTNSRCPAGWPISFTVAVVWVAVSPKQVFSIIKKNSEKFLILADFENWRGGLLIYQEQYSVIPKCAYLQRICLG